MHTVMPTFHPHAGPNMAALAIVPAECALAEGHGVGCSESSMSFRRESRVTVVAISILVGRTIDTGVSLDVLLRYSGGGREDSAFSATLAGRDAGAGQFYPVREAASYPRTATQSFRLAGVRSSAGFG